MKNNKVTSHPPLKQSAKDFIMGAENKTKTIEARYNQNTPTLPWHNEQVRQDVQKVFTVKLPEEYLLKIKYLSEYTNKSQQKIIREIISSNVDEILNKLKIE